jgi:voltage-gated potassium channel
MDYRLRIIRITIAIVLVIIFSTVGYVLIEKWSWFDSIYMTFITISTVGFKEVHELSKIGQIFTIIVIIGGTGTMLYAATTVVQYFLEGHLASILGRRHMKEEIGKLKDHIILCGYGKVGREVARVFQDEETKFIVVEGNKEIVDKATSDGYLCIQGDATSDDVLKQAGIQTARALVTALASDADNLYVTLSAKQLRPDIFVVARVYSEDSETKMKRAGADRTMSPYGIGGRRLAMLTLRPIVVDFIDMTTTTTGRQLVLEDVEIMSGSIMDGLTVKEWQGKSHGTQILAIKKKNKSLLTNPPPETKLELGDEVVIIGTREQLREIERAV